MTNDEEFKDFLGGVQNVSRLIDRATSLYQALAIQKNQIPVARDATTLPEEAKETLKSFQALLEQIEEQIEQLSALKTQADTKDYHKQIHIKGLTERTRRVLEAFRKEELSILEKEKTRLREQYLIAKPTATEEELSLLENTLKGQALIKAAYSLGNKDAYRAIQQAEQRHLTIVAMADDLMVLNAIADKLQQTLKQADTHINTISYNTYTISKDSQTANKHLAIGVKQKKRKKRFKLFVFILMAIIILLLLMPFINLFRTRK